MIHITSNRHSPVLITLSHEFQGLNLGVGNLIIYKRIIYIYDDYNNINVVNKQWFSRQHGKREVTVTGKRSSNM